MPLGADVRARGLISDWGLSVTPDAFLDAFRNWPVGPLPGAEALVRRVRQTMPVGCLSNTNTLHWQDHFERWPILDSFDFRFLSFELGVVKPDRELFERVADLLPMPPSRVLFLDDNLINVAGASAAGFVARLARGVDETRAALVEAGVIDAQTSTAS
jgi:HAD superfamily hydrolase (TIGR01509 family)